MSTLSAHNNPYASPRSNKRTTKNEAAVRLFSAKQTGIASFLASALAGMTLVSINHFRLGKTFAGIVSMLIGTAIFGVFFTLATVVPAPGVIYGFAQLGITIAIAKTMFEKQYERNLARNVKSASGWVVAGVTTAWVVVLVAIVLTFA
jgi:hypothetical protein